MLRLITFISTIIKFIMSYLPKLVEANKKKE